MEETNYLTYDEIPNEVKDAIAKNKTVGVAFVKKDGSVRHMAFRRYLMGYVPSEKEKTEKQLTMRVTHNQMTVYDTNLYIKAYRELQDVDKAAKQSFRVVTLDRVLGFLVGGKFLDMREKNNISERYGEDVYNEITKGMVRAMEKEAQEAETSANELESEVNEQYLNEDKWNRTRFQRLIEVMSTIDKSFKPKSNEQKNAKILKEEITQVEDENKILLNSFIEFLPPNLPNLIKSIMNKGQLGMDGAFYLLMGRFIDDYERKYSSEEANLINDLMEDDDYEEYFFEEIEKKYGPGVIEW